MDPLTPEHPDFWTEIMAPRSPAWREPIDLELIALDDDVQEAVDTFAREISVRFAEYRAAGHEIPTQAELAPDYQLARLYTWRQVAGLVERFAEVAATCAGRADGIGYPELAAAWGISRQAARKKWPDAVPTRGEPRPVELELAGGSASITQLVEGYVWEATAETGATAKGEEPYGSQAEAAAHAGAWLQRHQYDPAAAHADCIEPHRDSKGEYVDCDGVAL
ncbi:hypothetical protein ACFPK5_00290 [Streptomyces beijiangensis]|uniref:hypothetical protein n=1 Tax=Streptomyces beijiangensis TaxID=163361 RepID=UPI0031D011D4